MYFIFLVLFIYFSIHAFLYVSLINFFTLTQNAKYIAAIIIGALSLSFIISIILIRVGRLEIGGYLYNFSAFWIGLSIYLTFSFSATWLISKIFDLNQYDQKIALGAAAIILAFLYAFYGLYNAFHPVIKNIEVDIKNLPENWKDKGIVQLSDVHLGNIHGKKFAEKIVQKTNALNPEIILITGDLFDGIGSNPDDYISILNKFKSKYGVYFITGNHEIYLNVDSILEKLEHSNFKIIDGQVVNIEGLQIVGLGHPKFGTVNDVEQVFSETNGYVKELPTILLNHVPSNIKAEKKNGRAQQADTYLSPDTSFQYAKDKGINLQLSGHTHKGQLFPFNILTKFIYNGYDYGLHTDGDFNIYISSGAGTWGPPLRTGSKSEVVNILLR